MHSLTSFILATILALAIPPAPQSQQKSPPKEKTECGTAIPPEQFQAELARRNSAALNVTPPTHAPYYLPMTIHIVHRSDGTGGFTLDQLAVAMRDLNLMWQPIGIQFFIYGGIDHINDDTHFNVPDNRANQDALRRVNAVENTINIYFTNLQNLCGQSSFTKTAVQGVLMNIGCAGIASNPSTFAHEIGHYFDLLHTHETFFGVECPSGNNCTTAGDLLCDTAADPQLLINNIYRVDTNCVYDDSATLPVTCGKTPYNPPTRNLMSTSRQTCRNMFTVNQVSKVLNVLPNTENRMGLITNGTRYVSPFASASNTQCTYDSPCNTVAKAIRAAKDGDFIFLVPGAYQASSMGGKDVTLNRWGTAGVVEIGP